MGMQQTFFAAAENLSGKRHRSCPAFNPTFYTTFAMAFASIYPAGMAADGGENVVVRDKKLVVGAHAWYSGQRDKKQTAGEREMFTAEHLIWMVLCAAFIAGMTVLSTKKRWSLRQAGYVMTAICAFSEVSKVMSEMRASPAGGMALDPGALPFHLCSLMLFGVLYITFGREGRARQAVISFLAVMGTLGSFCAIMIPTNGTDFTQIYAYQCFVYHAGLLWFCLHLLLSGRAELGAKALVRNLGLLLALTFAMLYVNGALSAYGTNFMYVVRPPMEGLPFLNLDRGWYVYLLRLMLLGGGLVTLFHLPFILRERKKKREAAGAGRSGK